MNIPTFSWKKLMGTDDGKDELVEKKRQEAHDIKNKMTNDVLRIKKKVDRINRDTYIKLGEVSLALDTVTYNIAIASGGKRRGLK